MTSRRALLAAALAPALLSACEDFSHDYRIPVRVDPALAVGGRVAFLERANARVFLLDTDAATLRPRVVAVGTDPRLALVRNGHDELVVLALGVRESVDQEEEPASITVVPGDPARPVRRVPLAARFTSLAQSPDGRFLVAYFAPGTTTDGALFNPNEIAVVDLAAAEPRAVAKNLRSFGGTPLGFAFSPSDLPLPEGPRTLAAVFSINYVTLLDLDNLERAPITVRLTQPEDVRSLTPAHAVFHAPAGRASSPRLFVRASGSNDIYALRLDPVDAMERAGDQLKNDYRPSLQLLTAGSNPAAMVAYDAVTEDPNGGGGSKVVPRLLVAAQGSRDAHVIDVDSGHVIRVPLATAMDRIQLFRAPDPSGGEEHLRALLSGTGSTQLAFLDLDAVDLRGTRALSTSSMGRPATAVMIIGDGGRHLALVAHGGGDGAVLSVVDLVRGTVSPIFSAGAGGSHVLGRMPDAKVYFAPAGGLLTLGYLGLDTLDTGEVRLDAPIAQILPLAPGAGGQKVALVHPSQTGHVTVLDAEAPERGTARSIRGFLLWDLIERGDR